jgi:4-amino-4-deoxy-L-arabinose transferase-like glycosyltransferase
MSNQVESVETFLLRRYASFRTVLEKFQERLGQSATLGPFIRRGLQAILGVEFVVVLIASLRVGERISLTALIVELIFLLVAGAMCYLVATGRVDLKVAHFARLNFFPILIALGIALRLGWVLVMHPVQISDFRDYMVLARRLLDTGSYVDYSETGHRLLAFRPPGYPAFLASSIWLLGDNTWTPAIGNILVFIGSALVLGLAAKTLGGRRSAFIAQLLFILWPSDVFLTGLAASEPLALLLFTAALWVFSLSDVHGAKASVVAGILGGATALTRPTMLLFPLLWAVFVLVGPNRLVRLRHVVIASLVMAATLAPWTVRNYRILHAFVAVSTNGGDVFYRANNELATGSYTVAAEQDLGTLREESEIKWNAESYKRGKDWIRSHPLNFMKLAVRKAILFAQNDQTGIYWSMARGHQNVGPEYVALEVLSDAWWQLLCFLGLVAIWRAGLVPDALAALLAGGFGLLMIVHLVYESQPRYRMPGVGLLIVIIASSLCNGSK